MFVVWGSYPIDKLLEFFPIGFCGFCNFHGGMKVRTTAGLAHFMFIPLFVHSRKYFLMCPNCGNAIQITKEDFNRIKNGTWIAPIKDNSLHILNQDEIFVKVIVQEVRCAILTKMKKLKDPQKQEAVCAGIRKTFANRYRGNATVEQIVNDMLAEAVNSHPLR